MKRTDLVRGTVAMGSALLLATVAGCGAEVESSSGDSAHSASGRNTQPVTVRNCGKQVTYDHVPQRVVTNDIGITEIMFALGLEDHMAGYVMPSGKQDAVASSPWKKSYKQTKHLSDDQLTKELAVHAKADLVFAGWGYGFSDSTGVTPKALDKLGVDSYTLSESCRNGTDDHRGTMPPLRALYNDITTLGKVFHVEDRAKKLVHHYKKRVASVRDSGSSGTPSGGHAGKPTVFLYDSGEDKPFTAGRFAGPEDIISRAGGRNAMHGLADTWTQVGWESVVDKNPDVIVINDYGTPSAQAKKKFLRSYKPLAHTTAVKKNNFLVLPYVDLVESPRNPEAIVKLAHYLNTLRGKDDD